MKMAAHGRGLRKHRGQAKNATLQLHSLSAGPENCLVLAPPCPPRFLFSLPTLKKLTLPLPDNEAIS